MNKITAQDACDDEHEKDRVVVIIRSAVFTNLLNGSVSEDLLAIGLSISRALGKWEVL